MLAQTQEHAGQLASFNFHAKRESGIGRGEFTVFLAPNPARTPPQSTAKDGGEQPI